MRIDGILENFSIEVLSSLPTTNNTLGRLVINNNLVYYYNGTKWQQLLELNDTLQKQLAPVSDLAHTGYVTSVNAAGDRWEFKDLRELLLDIVPSHHEAQDFDGYVFVTSNTPVVGQIGLSNGYYYLNPKANDLVEIVKRFRLGSKFEIKNTGATNSISGYIDAGFIKTGNIFKFRFEADRGTTTVGTGTFTNNASVNLAMTGGLWIEGGSIIPARLASSDGTLVDTDKIVGVQGDEFVEDSADRLIPPGGTIGQFVKKTATSRQWATENPPPAPAANNVRGDYLITTNKRILSNDFILGLNASEDTIIKESVSDFSSRYEPSSLREREFLNYNFNSANETPANKGDVYIIYGTVLDGQRSSTFRFGRNYPSGLVGSEGIDNVNDTYIRNVNRYNRIGINFAILNGSSVSQFSSWINVSSIPTVASSVNILNSTNSLTVTINSLNYYLAVRNNNVVIAPATAQTGRAYIYYTLDFKNIIVIKPKDDDLNYFRANLKQNYAFKVVNSTNSNGTSFLLAEDAVESSGVFTAKVFYPSINRIGSGNNSNTLGHSIPNGIINITGYGKFIPNSRLKQSVSFSSDLLNKLSAVSVGAVTNTVNSLTPRLAPIPNTRVAGQYIQANAAGDALQFTPKSPVSPNLAFALTNYKERVIPVLLLSFNNGLSFEQVPMPRITEAGALITNSSCVLNRDNVYYVKVDGRNLTLIKTKINITNASQYETITIKSNFTPSGANLRTTHLLFIDESNFLLSYNTWADSTFKLAKFTKSNNIWTSTNITLPSGYVFDRILSAWDINNIYILSSSTGANNAIVIHKTTNGGTSWTLDSSSGVTLSLANSASAGFAKNLALNGNPKSKIKMVSENEWYMMTPGLSSIIDSTLRATVLTNILKKSIDKGLTWTTVNKSFVDAYNIVGTAGYVYSSNTFNLSAFLV